MHSRQELYTADAAMPAPAWCTRACRWSSRHTDQTNADDGSKRSCLNGDCLEIRHVGPLSKQTRQSCLQLCTTHRHLTPDTTCLDLLNAASAEIACEKVLKILQQCHSETCASAQAAYCLRVSRSSTVRAFSLVDASTTLGALPASLACFHLPAHRHHLPGSVRCQQDACMHAKSAGKHAPVPRLQALEAWWPGSAEIVACMCGMA